MARFPYHKENVKALGRLLAEASVDPDCRRRLEADPKSELRRIGLPEQTLALFEFKIVSEADKSPIAVLPFKLNQERLKRADPDYLNLVTKTVIGQAVN
jgi:hypothetical protein